MSQDPSNTVGISNEKRRVNRPFQDLLAWQRAMQMVHAVYQLTTQFLPAERLGLSSQMRRAAVSVLSNITEGYGRTTTGEFKRFLGHARGSNAEVETQVLIAKRIGFGSEQAIGKAERLWVDSSRLVSAVMRSLNS